MVVSWGLIKAWQKVFKHLVKKEVQDFLLFPIIHIHLHMCLSQLMYPDSKPINVLLLVKKEVQELLLISDYSYTSPYVSFSLSVSRFQTYQCAYRWIMNISECKESFEYQKQMPALCGHAPRIIHQTYAIMDFMMSFNQALNVYGSITIRWLCMQNYF